MKSIVFSKNVQKEKLYQDYLEFKKDCILYNLDNEDKHNSYSNYLKENSNQKISSYDRAIFSKSQSNLQKSSYIIEEGTKRGLVPIFMTITLPSNFHFLNGSGDKNKYTYHSINKNFNFIKLEYAIEDGYKLLGKYLEPFIKILKG